MLASYKQEETTSVTNGTNGAIGLVHFSIESYEDDLVQFWSVTATSLILKMTGSKLFRPDQVDFFTVIIHFGNIHFPME
jgi:hypothetical protein